MMTLTNFQKMLRILPLSRTSSTNLRHLVTVTAGPWRVNENDPMIHTSKHEGMFYELPKEGYTFSPDLTFFHQTINMIPMMIRKTSLDLVDRLNQLKDGDSNARFLIHGDKGRGKCHILIYLAHYLLSKKEHIVFSVRETGRITRWPREQLESKTRKGRIDTPLEAALLLQLFRTQNADLLEKYKDTLVCSQDYQWSLREVTKAGEPVEKIAEHGLDRVYHAPDCVAVLIKELMIAADGGKIKLASDIRNAQWLYEREAAVQKHDDMKSILVDEITVARAIKKMIASDFRNGITLITCHNTKSRKQNQTPEEIIGSENWEDIQPCTPWPVGNLTRKEFESFMNFYQDIGWLTRPESRTQEVRDEIRFVSGLNPSEVFKLCQPI